MGSSTGATPPSTFTMNSVPYLLHQGFPSGEALVYEPVTVRLSCWPLLIVIGPGVLNQVTPPPLSPSGGEQFTPTVSEPHGVPAQNQAFGKLSWIS